MQISDIRWRDLSAIYIYQKGRALSPVTHGTKLFIVTAKHFKCDIYIFGKRRFNQNLFTSGRVRDSDFAAVKCRTCDLRSLVMFFTGVIFGLYGRKVKWLAKIEGIADNGTFNITQMSANLCKSIGDRRALQIGIMIKAF